MKIERILYFKDCIAELESDELYKVLYTILIERPIPIDFHSVLLHFVNSFCKKMLPVFQTFSYSMTAKGLETLNKNSLFCMIRHALICSSAGLYDISQKSR